MKAEAEKKQTVEDLQSVHQELKKCANVILSKIPNLNVDFDLGGSVVGGTMTPMTFSLLFTHVNCQQFFQMFLFSGKKKIISNGIMLIF